MEDRRGRGRRREEGGGKTKKNSCDDPQERKGKNFSHPTTKFGREEEGEKCWCDENDSARKSSFLQLCNGRLGGKKSEQGRRWGSGQCSDGDTGRERERETQKSQTSSFS